MDIIERAARAIWKHWTIVQGREASDEAWDSVPAIGKQPYIDTARAVLSALREPDDAMERMGDLQSGDCIAIWQAMIDQALKG